MKTCTALVYAFVTSRLDYCNNLLSRNQQRIAEQARISSSVLSSPRHEKTTIRSDSRRYPEHFTLTLGSPKIRIQTRHPRLQMSPRRCPVLFDRVAVAVNPALQAHRSATRGDLVVPRTRTVEMGLRNYYVSGLMLWNLLPLEIRYHEQTLESFKIELKTYLFKKAYFSWLSKYIENCAGPPLMDIRFGRAIRMIFWIWIKLNWISVLGLLHGGCSEVLIQSTPKSCSLDPLPAFILREFMDELLPFIHAMCNVSMQHGMLPESQKSAIVTPILKKYELDPDDVRHYRPISNLTFLSKVIERIVALQLTGYLQENSFQILSHLTDRDTPQRPLSWRYSPTFWMPPIRLSWRSLDCWTWARPSTLSTTTKNPRKLWKTISSVLCKGKPGDQSASVGLKAEQFSKAFSDKISSVRSSTASVPHPDFNDPPGPIKLDAFNVVDVNEVRRLVVQAADKSCSLDPAPTWIVKRNVEDLLPFITTLINASIREDHFPSSLKCAIVTPILKKPSLDPDDPNNSDQCRTYRSFQRSWSDASMHNCMHISRIINCYLRSNQLTEGTTQRRRRFSTSCPTFSWLLTLARSLSLVYLTRGRRSMLSTTTSWWKDSNILSVSLATCWHGSGVTW